MSELEIEIPTAEIFEPLLQPARYKAAWGGRASGKSFFFAGEILSRCLDGVTDAVCLREIQKSLDQSAKKLLESLIDQYNLHDFFTVQENKILGPNGGNQIIFQGLQNHTADSIKSLEGYTLAWVEEAHKISQRSIDILRPTIRAENSEIWFSWNPENPDDPVDQFFRGAAGPPDDSIVVCANYYDNPWLPTVILDEVERDRQRDQDKFAHVWLGQYRRLSDALVFNNWTVREFDPPVGCMFRFGADWGFAQDPTVLLRGFVQGKELYIDYEIVGHGIEIDLLPDLFAMIPESQKWPIIADNARPELIDYMQSHGYPLIIPARKGKGSIEDGIDFLRSYDIVIHPRCKHTIKEFGNYSYKIDKATDQVLPIIESGQDDHCIDSARYMCESLRRLSQGAPVNMSVPKKVYYG